VALLLVSLSASASGIDWPSFISRQDPTWEKLPASWWEAPFLGNGLLGTLVRQTGEHELRWDVGHSYVHDHRAPDDYQVRAPEILNRGRLPIGHFILRTAGPIKGCSLRLNLWDAELSGRITTGSGSIHVRAFVHAVDMACLVEARADGDEKVEFEFVPEPATSSRYARSEKSLPASFRDAYAPNPEPVIREMRGGLRVCEQRLAAGGGTATAWSLTARDGLTRLIFSVDHSHPGLESFRHAVDAVRKAAAAREDAWVESHRAWWHDYYPASFVSLPDAYWESFYWIQMYKLACATRADRALIDNQGPWLQPTGWNGTWWNLNVQLSYSPVFAANRLELGEALERHFRRSFANLVDAVEPAYREDSAGLTRNTSMLDLAGRVGRPGGWEFPNKDIGSEVGDLPWMCHSLWQQSRYGGQAKKDMTRDLLYPLLKRAVNYYRHFLTADDDGVLHLPPTHSPEYAEAPDANFDLALIRWGCATLIDLSAELGVDAELRPVWSGILEKLAPYPINANGYMIGRGVGYDKSHRHWSHLLMIYPLRQVTPDNGGTETIRTSLDRWHGLKGAHAGYSFTGGAAIAALLGDGERAYDFLEAFKAFLRPSTMYYEGSGLPVMETPLHAACAIQEMLLQSWGGAIRVFPAMPAAWPDASFDSLRAEGAFLVSASRKDGKTSWVKVRSIDGGSCQIKTQWAADAKIDLPDGARCERLAEGLHQIQLKAGQSVLLRTVKAEECVPAAIPPALGIPHPFGLKR